MSLLLKRGLPAFLWMSMCVTALDLVSIPKLESHVTDLTGTLSQSEKLGLETLLANFENKKGSQIAVLMVPSTKPEAIEQFSLRVVEAWKLGREKTDDGLLFLVAKEDKAMRFEVGYGLEGVLPDALTNRIIDEIAVPHFKTGDFHGGIQAAMSAAIQAVQGETLPLPQKKPDQRDRSKSTGAFVMVALLIIFLTRSFFGRFLGGILAGGLVGVLGWFILGSIIVGVFWGVMALISTLLGFSGLPMGGRGLSSGGIGGFGGGSGGGGFSGGGGSFGGGGASGRW